MEDKRLESFLGGKHSQLEQIYPATPFWAFLPSASLLIALLPLWMTVEELVAQILVWVVFALLGSMGPTWTFFVLHQRKGRHAKCLSMYDGVVFLDETTCVYEARPYLFAHMAWARKVKQTILDRLGVTLCRSKTKPIWVSLKDVGDVFIKGQKVRGRASGDKAQVEFHQYDLDTSKSLVCHEIGHILLDRSRLRTANHHKLMAESSVDSAYKRMPRMDDGGERC